MRKPANIMYSITHIKDSCQINMGYLAFIRKLYHERKELNSVGLFNTLEVEPTVRSE